MANWWMCRFQLLDHEIHAKDQVPLLIEMKKADVALDKAIESGDPQLGNDRWTIILKAEMISRSILC